MRYSMRDIKNGPGDDNEGGTMRTENNITQAQKRAYEVVRLGNCTPREALLAEAIEYLADEVKQMQVAYGRTTRGSDTPMPSAVVPVNLPRGRIEDEWRSPDA